jgi:hypothetical protein
MSRPQAGVTGVTIDGWRRAFDLLCASPLPRSSL